MKFSNIFVVVLLLMISGVVFAGTEADSSSMMKKGMNTMSKDSAGMMHQKMNNMMDDTTKMNRGKMSQKMMKDNKMSPMAEDSKIWNSYCPVKGGKVDSSVPTIEYNGKTIGFCCPGCDDHFMKNPEKYMKNLSEDGKKYIGKKDKM